MKEKGIFLVFLTAVISGFSIFINKFSIVAVDPSVFAFAKNIVVALFLFSILLLLKNFSEIRTLSKNNLYKLIGIGFFGGSVPFLLFFNGLSITTAAKGAFLHKTMFLFVAILAFVFLKEKLSRKFLIPAVLLLIGNAIFLSMPFSELNIGDILIIAATLFWAVEITISKAALKELSPTTVAFGRMFFGSVFILTFLLATGEAHLITVLDGAQLLWIILTSILLFGYVFTFYSGLKHVSAHVATSILLLGSIITTTLSALFAETLITTNQIVGSVLLISGVVLLISLDKFIKYSRSIFRAKASNGWN